MDVRARFPIFERLIYINSCSQGALSDAVRQSYDDYLRDWDEQGAPWDYWVERTEVARTAFAGLINAEPDEVAVTTSLSAGVASLASGLRFAQRSKVVLTDLEFPTIGQIWHAQEALGARVVHASPDQLVELIDDDTLLVSTTHVSYRTGAMVDVAEVVRAAHEQGALVLLDAYQSVGSLPVDVKELDVGGTVVTPDRRGALICIASTDANALVAAMAERGIITSERDGNLRVSAHAYNTEGDIDAVLEALAVNPELLA